MNLEREAVRLADDFFDGLREGAFGLLEEAIDHRRDHPCYWARVRRNKAALLREHRPRLWKMRARWNDNRALAFEARCRAGDPTTASACGLCTTERTT